MDELLDRTTKAGAMSPVHLERIALDQYKSGGDFYYTADGQGYVVTHKYLKDYFDKVKNEPSDFERFTGRRK
jgi:hypothetical protein